MNDPRPRITSARPPERPSSVAKRWNTRTGSSELSTVTAEPRWMRSVRPAIAPSTTSGAETANSCAVVLADAEEVEAEPVGEHRLLDHVPQHLRVRQRRAVGPRGHVAEGVESEFVALSHRPAPSPRLHTYACPSRNPRQAETIPRTGASATDRQRAMPDACGIRPRRRPGMRPSRPALPDDVDASIARVGENGGVDVTDRPVIGIFGAGKVGTALARLLVASGYDVLITGSPRQTALDLLVSVVAPGARVVSPADLVAQADVIIVAVPFGKAGTVPWEDFGGRIVVDAMNYWPPVDGHIAAIDDDERSTSEINAARNPLARVVKSLNHLGYHEMEDDSMDAGSPLRRALAVVGDDADARAVIARHHRRHRLRRGRRRPARQRPRARARASRVRPRAVGGRAVGAAVARRAPRRLTRTRRAGGIRSPRVEAMPDPVDRALRRAGAPLAHGAAADRLGGARPSRPRRLRPLPRTPRRALPPRARAPRVRAGHRAGTALPLAWARRRRSGRAHGALRRRAGGRGRRLDVPAVRGPHPRRIGARPRHARRQGAAARAARGRREPARRRLHARARRLPLVRRQRGEPRRGRRGDRRPVPRARHHAVARARRGRCGRRRAPAVREGARGDGRRRREGRADAAPLGPRRGRARLRAAHHDPHRPHRARAAPARRRTRSRSGCRARCAPCSQPSCRTPGAAHACCCACSSHSHG